MFVVRSIGFEANDRRDPGHIGVDVSVLLLPGTAVSEPPEFQVQSARG